MFILGCMQFWFADIFDKSWSFLSFLSSSLLSFLWVACWQGNKLFLWEWLIDWCLKPTLAVFLWEWLIDWCLIPTLAVFLWEWLIVANTNINSWEKFIYKWTKERILYNYIKSHGNYIHNLCMCKVKYIEGNFLTTFFIKPMKDITLELITICIHLL